MVIGTTTALIIGGIGLAVGAAGTITAGIAAKQTAEFNAQVAEQSALRARQVAQAKGTDFRRKTSRQRSTSRTAVVAAGGDPDAGSSLLSFQDFSKEAELDALTIENQGIVQSSRLEQQASLFRAGGKNAKNASFVRAGATLLKGFSTLSSFGSGSGTSVNV